MVEIKKLAGAVAAATVMFSIGAVAPASAADNQAFGIQQSVTDPSGGEIAYTVTKLLPSEDAVPYPLSGQLYEVTVRANAVNGIVTPVVPHFSAVTEGGQSYPALAGAWTPQGFNSAPLLPGGSSSGKVYFDAVGEPPTGVGYNGAGQSLRWMEPLAASEEEAAPEEEAATPAEAAAPEEGAGSGASSEANADVATSEDEG